MPFVDPSCMPDRQGFSDKDIETTHKPNNRQAIPELAHACQHRQPLQRWCTQPMILHQHGDFQIETKIAARPGVLGKDAFYEHAWKVKCVDTILHDWLMYVTLETLAGETPALTTQE